MLSLDLDGKSARVDLSPPLRLLRTCWRSDHWRSDRAPDEFIGDHAISIRKRLPTVPMCRCVEILQPFCLPCQTACIVKRTPGPGPGENASP